MMAMRMPMAMSMTMTTLPCPAYVPLTPYKFRVSGLAPLGQDCLVDSFDHLPFGGKQSRNRNSKLTFNLVISEVRSRQFRKSVQA